MKNGTIRNLNNCYPCYGVSSVVPFENEFYSNFFFELDNVKDIEKIMHKTQMLCNFYELDLIIISSSKNGLHFVCPRIFPPGTVTKLQKEFKYEFKDLGDSDYFLCNKQMVKKTKQFVINDKTVKYEYRGNILRLSPKPNKIIRVINVIYSKNINPASITEPHRHFINNGILKIYKRFGLRKDDINDFYKRYIVIDYLNNIEFYLTKKP